MYRSLLHVVYLQNESDFAEYLIAKGADTQATDMQGLKPIEHKGGCEAMIKVSQRKVNRRRIKEDFHGEAHVRYQTLLTEGYLDEEAVSLVIESFPLLKLEKPTEKKPKHQDDVPTLRELNCYILDLAPFILTLD